MQREPAPPFYYAERTSPTLLLYGETLSVQLARLSNVKTSWKGSSYEPNKLPLDPPLQSQCTYSLCMHDVSDTIFTTKMPLKPCTSRGEHVAS